MVIHAPDLGHSPIVCLRRGTLPCEDDAVHGRNAQLAVTRQQRRELAKSTL